MLFSLEKWKEACLPNNIRVLQTFYNSKILALEKPSGFLSHPNLPKADSDSKQIQKNLIKGKYDEKEEVYRSKFGSYPQPTVEYKTYLLHRLDKSTSGVILIATDKDVAKLVKKAFKQRSVSKEYCAVIFGQPFQRRGRKEHTEEEVWMDDYGGFSPGIRQLVRPTSQNSHSKKMAETKVSLIEYFPEKNLSLIKMKPSTGFTHQLRYQCANRGYPILGDDLYGDFSRNRDMKLKRLFLHAKSISLNLKMGNREDVQLEIAADSPLPREFKQFQ